MFSPAIICGAGRMGCAPTQRDDRLLANGRSLGNGRSLSAERRRELEALAERVEALQRGRRSSWGWCATGFPELDAVLGGGFARGSVHELMGGRGTPLRTLALLSAGRAASGLSIFYIDTEGDFYPPAAARLVAPLDRLLIIKPRREIDALWVCEQALRCPAVAAVVLPIRNIDVRSSRRLQLAAEVGGGMAFLLLDDRRGGHTFSATRLRLELSPNKNPALCSSESGAAWLVRVSCLKPRGGGAAEPFEMVLTDDPRRGERLAQ